MFQVFLYTNNGSPEGPSRSSDQRSSHQRSNDQRSNDQRSSDQRSNDQRTYSIDGVSLGTFHLSYYNNQIRVYILLRLVVTYGIGSRIRKFCSFVFCQQQQQQKYLGNKHI
jgi:hypothetical protein